MLPNYTPAAVTSEQLDQIQELEQTIGKVVIAVQPEAQYAYLNQDALKTLQKAEKELGVVMIAYDD